MPTLLDPATVEVGDQVVLVFGCIAYDRVGVPADVPAGCVGTVKGMDVFPPGGFLRWRMLLDLGGGLAVALDDPEWWKLDAVPRKWPPCWRDEG